MRFETHQLRMSSRAKARTLASKIVAPFIIALVSPAITVAQSGAPTTSDGPNALTETYRDWVVRCDTGTGGDRRCEMAQQLRQQDGRLVFATLIETMGDTDAKVVFVAPFGLSLPAGLRLQGDELAAGPLAFSTCFSTGCLAEITWDEATVERLSDQEALAVEMTSVTGERVDLSLSLAGFRGAWRRLRGLAE